MPRSRSPESTIPDSTSNERRFRWRDRLHGRQPPNPDDREPPELEADLRPEDSSPGISRFPERLTSVSPDRELLTQCSLNSFLLWCHDKLTAGDWTPPGIRDPSYPMPVGRCRQTKSDEGCETYDRIKWERRDTVEREGRRRRKQRRRRVRWEEEEEDDYSPSPPGIRTVWEGEENRSLDADIIPVCETRDHQGAGSSGVQCEREVRRRYTVEREVPGRVRSGYKWLQRQDCGRKERVSAVKRLDKKARQPSTSGQGIELDSCKFYLTPKRPSGNVHIYLESVGGNKLVLKAEVGVPHENKIKNFWKRVKHFFG